MSLPFSRRARLTAALGVVAVAAGLTACGGAGHAATKAAAAAPAAAPADAPMAPMVQGHDMAANGATPSSVAPAAVATSAVTIDNFSFSPKAITVKAGTTVTWTNKDEEPHSVVSSEEPMRSPTLAGNTTTFSRTFAKPGTYHYNCGIHPFMQGTVEVTQ